MPAPSSSGPGWNPLAWRRAWLGIDQNEAVKRFVQTPLGVGLLHLVFIAVICVGLSDIALPWPSIAVLLLCALLPKRRLEVTLGCSTFYMIYAAGKFGDSQTALATVASQTTLGDLPIRALTMPMGVVVLLLLWGAMHLFVRHRSHPLAQWPLATTFAVHFGVVFLAGSGLLAPLPTLFLWVFAAVLAPCVFMLNYGIANLKAKKAHPVWQHAGLLRPYWTHIPWLAGKGVAYLLKFDAKNDDELAVTRLKALKLGVWGTILFGSVTAFDWMTNTKLGIPHLADALLAQDAGQDFGMGMSWAIVVAHFLGRILSVCTYGHLIVSIVRMTGYRLPRNSVSPLGSRTLAEFWNRYQFYFKEYLTDFFFFPAFTRFFKKSPKLRVAFATFSAAMIGNCLMHLVDYVVNKVPVYGLGQALLDFRGYPFYATALAIGIIISQLRNKPPRKEDGFLRYDVLPRVTVLLFFCVLSIFDVFVDKLSLWARFDFLFNLFGA